MMSIRNARRATKQKRADQVQRRKIPRIPVRYYVLITVLPANQSAKYWQPTHSLTVFFVWGPRLSDPQ